MTEDIRRIVGTAGHIDHGKTSLVRALTGVDCDRLPEEKRRGITIDLGFAEWKLPGLQIGFVDVPGHERFVKNMLAGIGGIDSVLLVVAADESIKPQTREHFAICKLLGINEGVVALTKSDLVDPEILELVRLEVADLVRGSFLEGKPVVPVSSVTGAGLDALREAVTESVRRSPDPSLRGGVFRLPIDRAFTVKGFGTVVTGTLVSGGVRRDDEIEILPDGLKVRARNIEVHGEPRPNANAGERTSVNLSDVAVSDLHRGQQLAHPGSLQPSQILTVDLRLLEGGGELKDLTRVRLHHYSAELLATVKLLDGSDRLRAGATAAAQLRVESPVAAVAGDRFVIRRYSPAITIGGGTVLDPHLPKLRAGMRAGLLDTLRGGTSMAKIELFARFNGIRGVTAEEVARRWGQASTAVVELVKKEKPKLLVAVTPSGPWLHSETLQETRRKAMTLLQAFFTRERMSVGLPKGEFLHKLLPPTVDGRVVDFVLRDLIAEKILVINGDVVDVPGRSREIGGVEGELARAIENRFREAGLKTPAVSEIIKGIPQKPKVIEGVVAFLVKRGTLVRIAEGVYLHSDAVAAATERMREHRGETIDVGWFKNFFDLSRKVAIPLLEYFDQKGVTRRQGDQRLVL